MKISSVVFGILVLHLSLQVKAAEPAWVQHRSAAWQARDSQAEWAFRNQFWMGGGWFNSYEAPPRDLWKSADGNKWEKVVQVAPWKHSDLPMNTVFADKMWLMGGWYNGRLPGHAGSSEVWSSADGVDWELETNQPGWTPRCAGVVVVHLNQLWLLGGTENYYFGNATSLKNDVWASADGKNWKQITLAAPWSPRAYHQAVVHDGRIYVLGGGNYTPEYHAIGDVWSSADGRNWRCETKQAAWDSRLWFSAVVYRDHIWVLGGWSREKDNFGDVWYSNNGRDWKQLQTTHCWKPRHEHSALVLHDQIWVMGGHARPLSDEVWSLQLPENWQP